MIDVYYAILSLFIYFTWLAGDSHTETDQTDDQYDPHLVAVKLKLRTSKTICN